MKKDANTFRIYADGAISYKNKIGGIGFIISCDSDPTTYFQYSQAFNETDEDPVTNIRMELMSVILSLDLLSTELFTQTGCTVSNATVIVHSDSAYVINGINQYVRRWEMNGWENNEGKPVSNRDLWERLRAIQRKYKRNKLSFVKVDGHSGNFFNELSDSLAQTSAHGKPVNKRIRQKSSSNK